MNRNDTARVRTPRDGFEYRLGTVTDVQPASHAGDVDRYRLRFPTGAERTYLTADITACTRADDYAALTAAVTESGEALRYACRVAHDYDQALSNDITHLLMDLYVTARVRLRLTLDPAPLTQHLDTRHPATGHDGAAGAQP
jgi:hypothetical protein